MFHFLVAILLNYARNFSSHRGRGSMPRSKLYWRGFTQTNLLFSCSSCILETVVYLFSSTVSKIITWLLEVLGFLYFCFRVNITHCGEFTWLTAILEKQDSILKASFCWCLQGHPNTWSCQRWLTSFLHKAAKLTQTFHGVFFTTCLLIVYLLGLDSLTS